MEDYPTETELNTLIEWDSIKNPKGLVEFVGDIWHIPDHGFNLCPGFQKNSIGQKVKKLCLATGGWSGNEDIITALQDNKTHFWLMYWTLSKRGGYYEFEVPKDRWQ